MPTRITVGDNDLANIHIDRVPQLAIDHTVNATPYSGDRDRKFAKIVGGCPCESCPNATRCKDEELACRRFAVWQQGRDQDPNDFSREPTREQYLRILA